MSPKFKLTYFDLMGLAEPIRLVFAYAGVEYEDVRLPREEWPSLKPQTPWGVMPILEEDGKQLSQSGTILRYLGRKFGLAGEYEFQTAKCEEYVDALGDVRVETAHIFREEDEKKKEEMKKKLKEQTIPQVCRKFDEILNKNGTGFLVGNKMTFADIYVAHFLPILAKFVDVMDTQIQASYPALDAHQKKILGSPGIREWTVKRPFSLF